MSFINGHRERWGVEPICLVLEIAPSTYYAAVSRPPSARELRDNQLKPEVARVHQENYGVYGAHKVWRQLNREGIKVGRDQVRRLMRELQLWGVRRGKVKRTTLPGDVGERPQDLVERTFTASAPNRLWVADLTYVSAWIGFVYVAFVVDAFSRRIVGWRVSASLHAELALDALEMAIWSRQAVDLTGLVHYSDRGVQGEFKRSSQHYVRRSCDAEAKKAPIRSCGQAAPTVAGAAWLGSTGTEAAILGRDRRRPVERGRRRGRGRIVSCRLALVPRKWRDAFNQPDATLGTLPLVP